MPIYEASFLGDPLPIKTPRKKAAPKKVAALELDDTPVSVPKRKRASPKSKPIPKEPVQLNTPPPSETSVESDEPVLPKPKRVRKKVEKKEPTQAQTETALEEVVNEPSTIKKVNLKAIKAANKKIIVSGQVADEPPTWFKAYLHDEQKRRNADKPKKERSSAPAVKQAAEVQAAVKWSDGLTRDKVNNEVNGHMARLYNQIYGKKFH